MPVNETNALLLSGFSAGLQTIGLHGLNFDRFLDGVIAAFVAEPHEHHEHKEYWTSPSAARHATSSEHTRSGPVPAAFPARGAVPDLRV
jgi:hypothetical protein